VSLPLECPPKVRQENKRQFSQRRTDVQEAQTGFQPRIQAGGGG
jgi:hypothetical protein